LSVTVTAFVGRVDLVEVGGMAFDRATFQPGWRWSKQNQK
jgi:hypothetical protein